MASRLQRLYSKLKDQLIASQEVDFYEDSRSFTETFSTKEKCLGCFEVINDTPKLIVAIGGDREYAYSVFLHEYCHFQQWKDNTEVWINEWLTKEEKKRFKKFFKKLDKIECNMILDYWRNSKFELNRDEITLFTQRTMAVERDCESRVIELLKQHKVSKKFIKEYTQRANLYLLNYLYQLKYRVWKEGITAYKKLPDVLFSMDQLKELSPEIEAWLYNNIKKEEG